MPRKRRDEYEQLVGILNARGALDGWQLDLLEGRSEAEVAARLRESVLFISLSRAEGFGLPPAEAMACGNHAIGFHGMGGREIFRPPFAQAIEDGDVLALATAVEEFLAGPTTGEPRSWSSWRWRAPGSSRRRTRGARDRGSRSGSSNRSSSPRVPT